MELHTSAHHVRNTRLAENGIEFAPAQAACHNYDYMELLSSLRRVRKSKGLSQTELAERANLDQPTVSRLETINYPAYPGQILKLAAALQVQPKELL